MSANNTLKINIPTIATKQLKKAVSMVRKKLPRYLPQLVLIQVRTNISRTITHFHKRMWELSIKNGLKISIYLMKALQ